MIKKIEIEAKSEAEALEKAQAELGVKKDKINLTLIKENKGFLGIGAFYIYEASLNENLANQGKKYLESILKSLNVNYRMEVRNLNNEHDIYYSIESNENPILIGRDGRTLEALQTLLKDYLCNLTKEKIVVSVDVGSYKENRKRQLEILATKVAKEVAKTKNPVKLDPLNAYERRIIHTKLADWHDIYTESEGEGENRRLVIHPKNNGTSPK